MRSIIINKNVSELELDADILEKLHSKKVYIIKDLWKLTRMDLKEFDLSDVQINQIIIKLQLCGIDLNKRVYNKN
ncbi:MAG TPA: hypothetical protein GX725_03380 [Mollicutes bacterium]|jgi:hypothetical protein|nr:hypothetical protein [Mollicutes bacterium]